MLRLKQNIFTWIQRLSMAGLTLGLLAGCRGIPNEYTGEYEDSTRRVKLELSSYEGTIQFADGRSFNAKLEDLNYEKMKDGKRAIYARPNSKNQDLVEIFMVEPDLSSKQESQGLTWFQSEIVYSMIDTKNASASRSITLVHCRQGVVMLDRQSQQVQLGCPENPERITLQKTRDGGSGGGGGSDPGWPGYGGGN